MRVLVTGGAGYVGGVIAARLLEQGHEVTVYDLRDGCDIRDHLRLAKALPGHDTVVHCAARTLVSESFADPAGYWDVNMGGTYTLLNSMRKSGVRRIVFSSTAAVYGARGFLDLTEDWPVTPVTPYGASKLAAENLLASFARHHQFAAASLRYFNVAGAHWHDGRWTGERHDPETHLIPSVLAAAAAGMPVKVHGGDYPTLDGTCVRDYVHVADLADAHLLALQAVQPGEHRTWNLGTRAGFTVREVIELCREVTGLPIREDIAPRRAGDPARLVASAARARADLGWNPTGDLRSIVATAWEFMKQEVAP